MVMDPHNFYRDPGKYLKAYILGTLDGPFSGYISIPKWIKIISKLEVLTIPTSQRTLIVSDIPLFHILWLF